MTYLIELTAPADVDAGPNWLLHAREALDVQASTRLVGNGDLTESAAELFADLQRPKSKVVVYLVAVDGECPPDAPRNARGYVEVSVSDHAWPQADVLGTAIAWFPLKENVRLMEGAEYVLAATAPPELASTILQEFDKLAAYFDRDVATAFSWHRLDVDTEVIPAASGEGTIPLDAESRPFVDAGYELMQVERNSKVDLPVAEEKLAACEARVAAGFAIETLTSLVTASDREDMRLLLARLDVDAPSEGVDFELPVWDDERLSRWETRRWSELASTVLAVARHRATGRIVGYSEVMVPLDKQNVVFQGGTLVHPDFRGHGLGWGVKAAALRRLAADFPDRRYISTWNAAENPWMLAINVFLGFAPWSVSGVWRKKFPTR